ncbi:MAG: hypothetical protein AAGE18_16930 [Pseudomonadota bacterium]
MEPAVDGVVAVSTPEKVVVSAAVDDVVAAPADDRVEPGSTSGDLTILTKDKEVFPAPGDDDTVAPRARRAEVDVVVPSNSIRPLIEPVLTISMELDRLMMRPEIAPALVNKNCENID